ncbi:ankyrin repeat domain-containing protein [Actinoallomurus sp. CA-150999]|uniref:ankyrin repeat domain-containing protein n=1 Tax=Actinoallomurus sp. CA-150999 TaxID=3239887 RepID=UPI003D93D064
MDIDEMLRCLIEADSERLRPELCDGRYAAVLYDEEASPELDDEFDDDDDPLHAEVVGEASSVYDALDHVANVFCDFGEDTTEEILDEYEDEEELDGIRTAGRRLLAITALGYMGPMDIVTDDHWNDHYLGKAPVLFPGARFVFLASAAPPHQEEAYAVLELQPTGSPSPADRSLMEADDASAVAAALADGADVNALDDRGMSPLHHAVARRRPDAVAALLAAGADPALQAGFGNAPHFAALVGGETVKAATGRIEDADHRRILRTLVEAGAPVNAGDLTGATLLDLAIATRPYPEETIRFLTDRGAHAAHLASSPLAELLRSLPYYSTASMETRLNEVRFLLDSGASADGALHALLGFYGYYEREVSSETLVAFVDEILRHGARDIPDSDGRTALDLAERWLANGKLPNYEPVVERLRALHSRSDS